MDKLTLISGTLFMTADIFAIVSLARPDWIVTDIGGNHFLSSNYLHSTANNNHRRNQNGINVDLYDSLQKRTSVFHT